MGPTCFGQPECLGGSAPTGGFGARGRGLDDVFFNKVVQVAPNAGSGKPQLSGELRGCERSGREDAGKNLPTGFPICCSCIGHGFPLTSFRARIGV